MKWLTRRYKQGSTLHVIIIFSRGHCILDNIFTILLNRKILVNNRIVIKNIYTFLSLIWLRSLLKIDHYFQIIAIDFESLSKLFIIVVTTIIVINSFYN